MALGYSWTTLNSTSASVGSFSANFYIQAKLNSQNTDSNTSNVSYRWYIEITYGWANSYSARDYVSNAGWNESTYRSYTSSGTLREWSGNISHNADGTKSISATGRTIMGGIGLDTGDVTGSIALPTIARGSKITTFDNFTIENGITLAYKDSVSSKSLTFTVKIGNTTIKTQSATSSAGDHPGYTITFNSSELAAIYSAIGSSNNSATFTVVLATVIGSSTLTDTKTAIGTMSTSNAPSITGAAMAEVALASIDVADNDIVRYMSSKDVTALVVGLNGATIASVTVANGVDVRNASLTSTPNQYKVAAFDSLTSDTFIITAVDSRGFSTSVTLTASNFIQYTYPTINEVKIYRTSELSDEGHVEPTGTMFRGAIGSISQNYLTWKIKIDGNPTMNLSDVGIGYRANGIWYGEKTLAADSVNALTRTSPHTAIVEVTDMVGGTVSATATIGVAKLALWLGRYTAKSEYLVANHWIGFYKVGDIFLTLNNENPSVRFGGTWQLISAGRVLMGAGTGIDGNSDSLTVAAGDTGGEYNHTLITNEIPSHHHGVRRHSGADDLNFSGTNNVNAVTSCDTDTFQNYASTTDEGGGGAHNNIQPYLACYIWQKTAD